jgi:hypothetical protein
MFLSAYNSTARDGSAGFINKRFGPRQVILFDHSFRDALIDELIHRVINGCKLATRHAPRATRASSHACWSGARKIVMLDILPQATSYR